MNSTETELPTKAKSSLEVNTIWLEDSDPILSNLRFFYNKERSFTALKEKDERSVENYRKMNQFFKADVINWIN